MAHPLQPVVNALSAFTHQSGVISRWLAVFMVIATSLVVALRYLFDYSSIGLQETVMYLHASLFMLGAAYTWQQNGHVRVDIFYQKFSPLKQRTVDVAGTLLLLIPTCLFLLWSSWEYVNTAWAIGEKSQEAGGLPFVYLLKTLILLMPIMMLVQALNFLLQQLPGMTNPVAIEESTEADHG